jgi:hypothetical protein
MLTISVSYRTATCFDILYAIREFIIVYADVTKLMNWKHIDRLLLQKINELKLYNVTYDVRMLIILKMFVVMHVGLAPLIPVMDHLNYVDNKSRTVRGTNADFT